jgi:steroid delta-isomerase-like uncharacterized protein
MNSGKEGVVISTIEKYYRAFNEKRFNDMVDLLTDDVVHEINQGERQQGKKAFVAFLKNMDRFYDEHLEDVAIFSGTNKNRFAAEFICHGVYKESAPGLPNAKGQQYKLPVGAFFELRGESISRITNYYNMSDWLKQVTGPE